MDYGEKTPSCDPLILFPIDYAVCGETDVHCQSGLQCIPRGAICDGWGDCDDMSDEFGCREYKNLVLHSI